MARVLVGNFKGVDGVSPKIRVGNVRTVAYNQPARVTKVGTEQDVVFDFDIPQGKDGGSGGGGGGTSDYDELENKPSINNVELIGNKTLQQLGIQGTLPFRFGIDENGDYGYYKVGADTLTPFNAGGEPVPYGGTRMRGLQGNYGIATQII